MKVPVHTGPQVEGWRRRCPSHGGPWTNPVGIFLIFMERNRIADGRHPSFPSRSVCDNDGVHLQGVAEGTCSRQPCLMPLVHWLGANPRDRADGLALVSGQSLDSTDRAREEKEKKKNGQIARRLLAAPPSTAQATVASYLRAFPSFLPFSCYFLALPSQTGQIETWQVRAVACAVPSRRPLKPHERVHERGNTHARDKSVRCTRLKETCVCC